MDPRLEGAHCYYCAYSITLIASAGRLVDERSNYVRTRVRIPEEQLLLLSNRFAAKFTVHYYGAWCSNHGILLVHMIQTTQYGILDNRCCYSNGWLVYT